MFIYVVIVMFVSFMEQVFDKMLVSFVFGSLLHPHTQSQTSVYFNVACLLSLSLGASSDDKCILAPAENSSVRITLGSREPTECVA